MDAGREGEWVDALHNFVGNFLHQIFCEIFLLQFFWENISREVYLLEFFFWKIQPK